MTTASAPVTRAPIERWAPVAAVAIALVVRWWAWRFDPWVTGDGAEYIGFAEALRRGTLVQSYFPPGYPALIAVARLFTTNRVVAAATVSTACGALLCWPVWVLARRALGARWALLPLAAVVLDPALVKFSTLTMSESSYLLALYAALALAGAGRPLLAGLAFGAAFDIRPEALLPALAVAVASCFAPRAADARGARGRALLAGTAGFLALAIPCWFYIHATWGAWTLTPKVSALRAPYAAGQDEAIGLGAAARVDSDYGLDRVLRHLPEALAHYVPNARLHARALLQLWPWPLFLLSLWGLARRRGLESLPLLHLLALPLFGLSGQVRFVLVALPSLALAATAAARHSPRWSRSVAALLALGGIALNADGFQAQLTAPFEGDWGAHRDAGEWLAGSSRPGDRVMDRKPYVAFYADRSYWKIPDGTYDEILAAAERDSVRWLVVDEGVARTFRPQLLPLLFDPAFREREVRLEAAYVGGRFEGHTIALFRVLRPGEARTGRGPRVALRWLEDARPPAVPKRVNGSSRPD